VVIVNFDSISPSKEHFGSLLNFTLKQLHHFFRGIGPTAIITCLYKRFFIIIEEKIDGSYRPRAIDPTTTKVGGNRRKREKNDVSMVGGPYAQNFLPFPPEIWGVVE
jgi:hypothetical protein